MLSIENRIDNIINRLIMTGSDIPYLNELRDTSYSLIRSDISLEDALKGIADEIAVFTQEFLEPQNEFKTHFISGISTGIYLPNYRTGSNYKLKIVGGTTSRDGNVPVDDDTLFDIASITKLYTLVLCYKLEELGLLNLNVPIKDINPDFQNLEDFTLNDLIRLHGEIRTDGRVDNANSYEEALELFKTSYLYSNDRTHNKYTDFGAMIIANTIEKVVSKHLYRDMKFDDIMYEFLFKPLHINSTMYRPGIINVSGNGNNLGLPHDPKSKVLGGVTGHAGLFTDTEGLMRLADGLFEGYLNKEHMYLMGKKTFNDSSKGRLGLYLKHPKGWSGTYNPPEFSDGSFSHQGWTGAVASFDPNNNIHNSILVNAVKTGVDPKELKNDKPLGFSPYFGIYQRFVMRYVMMMYVVKKYYNNYFGVQDSIEDYRKIL